MQRKAICLTLIALYGVGAQAQQNIWRSETLTTLASNFARTRFADERNVELQVTALDPRLGVAACDETLTHSINVVARETGRLTVTLHCARPIEWVVPVQFTMMSNVEVYVATRPLRPYEPLADAALLIERRRLPGRPQAWLSPPFDVRASNSRRAITAGEALRIDDVQPSTWIKRGDTVVVIARSAGVEVRNEAIALADARPGDPVRLRNTQSGRLLLGRASAPGTATLGLD